MSKEEKKEQDTQVAAQTNEEKQLVDSRLVKPLPHAQETKHYVPPTPARTIDGQKRKKSFGEKLFDWSIYGGIGWIGNELLSGVIFDNAAYDKSRFHKFYTGGLNAVSKTIEKVSKLTPEAALKAVRRPWSIFVLTIGGNLLVLPMKIAEDHKGKLVRFADHTFGGDKAKNDPQLQKAHEDMDNAPKQSWGSLAQSRLVTLAGAIGIDYAFGSSNAWSTKLFRSDGMKKWASLDNINTTIFRGLGKFADEHLGFDKGAADRIRYAEKHSPFELITDKVLDNLPKDSKLRNLSKPLEAEGKLASVGKSFGFIFLLSGVLAGTFYLTSRVFAQNREKKKEHMEQHKASGTRHIGLDSTSAVSATDQLDTAPEEKPKNKIAHAQLASREQAAQQGAVGI